MSDRQQLIDQLRLRVVNVEFVKQDGSLRHMQATLQESLLPKATSVPAAEKPSSDQVIKVWDTQAASWRSFRMDRLVKWY